LKLDNVTPGLALRYALTGLWGRQLYSSGQKPAGTGDLHAYR